MLLIDVLGLPSEHGQSEALLDEFMAVDRWRNRADKALGDVLGLGSLSDLLLFLIGQFNDVLVSKAS